MSSNSTLSQAPVADPPAKNSASWRGLLRWESGLVLVLLASILFGASESPHFLTSTDVFFIGLNMGEIAIMALPLTLIVMTGEIDLSVASMLGLSSTLLGYFFEHHWPIAWAIVAVLIVGAAGVPSTGSSSPSSGCRRSQ